MTKQELNRDIKKLFKNFNKLYSTYDPNYYKELEKLKTELLRLYRADDSLESLSKDNILRLLVLNRAHRVISLHTFGVHINEEKL